MGFGHFRYRGSGNSASIGCGTLLALLGLVLLSPAGVWLVKGLGWACLVLGLLLAATGLYYWLFPVPPVAGKAGVGPVHERSNNSTRTSPGALTKAILSPGRME